MSGFFWFAHLRLKHGRRKEIRMTSQTLACPALHPPAAYLEKILFPDQASRLAREGWHAADLHVHSFCSEDVLPVPATDTRKMYEEGRRRGLSYLTFTDHDTMDAYDLLGWEREGLVPGVEFKILDRREVGHTIHINVYLLDKHPFKELLRMARREGNLEHFLDFLRTNELPHTYNHPFWFEEGERPNPEAVVRVAQMIDPEQAAALDIGVRPLEWLFNVVATQGVAGRPRLKRHLRRLLETVSNAGLIQSFYIRSQGAVASRVTRELGLSTLLDGG
jgi:hypothetical protein